MVMTVTETEMQEELSVLEGKIKHDFECSLELEFL